MKLPAESQLLHELLVHTLILLLQIIEELPAATDQFEEALAGVVVAGVRVEMVGQLVDPRGEERDLDAG